MGACGKFRISKLELPDNFKFKFLMRNESDGGQALRRPFDGLCFSEFEFVSDFRFRVSYPAAAESHGWFVRSTTRHSMPLLIID